MTSSNEVLSARGLGLLVGLVILAAFVGGATGAIVALRVNTPSSQPDESVSSHLDAIRPLFDAEWPRVESTEGARSSEDLFIGLYNAQTPLEYEWVSLAGRIRVDGIDFVRDEVENWRERYAEWVEEAGQALRDLSSSDPHYRSVETVHFRGGRILEHVDAILSL